MSGLVNPEQDNKVLIDALKYTSDIVVSLTEKISLQEQKINQLEKIIIDLKNDTKFEFQKNEKKINNIFDKLNDFERDSNQNSLFKDNTQKNQDTNSESNIDFEILSQTMKDLTSGLNLNLDLETINNTICNSTMVSDVTSFNNEDITNFKKNKASNLVQNLIKQKLDLEKKINTFIDNQNTGNSQVSTNIKNTSNSNIIIENDKDKNTSQSIQNNIDINAIRKKKNFARRF